MKTHRSLRSQFILMITFFSSVGLFSALIIMNVNYNNSLDETRDLTLALLKREIVTLTDKHSDILNELGLRIQKSLEFKEAVQRYDKEKIKTLLNEEFSLYYMSTQVLIIDKFYAFDLDYNLITESDQGEDFETYFKFCSNLINKAKLRKGIERLKRIQTFCNYNENIFNSILVPISTTSPIGYLQIVSRPYNIFKHAEDVLGMPMRIESINNGVSYQSTLWGKNKDSLIISYIIQDIFQKDIAVVKIEKDIKRLNQSFFKTSMLILLVIGIITFFGMIFTYFRFDKNLLRPIKELEIQLSLIEKDEAKLGSLLPFSGSPEIQTLIRKFNALSTKLAESYESLERLAYIDPLTFLPNRAKLLEILTCHTGDSFDFCLIVLNIDRFKSVNDAMGYAAGDALLQQVSHRLESVLNHQDTNDSISFGSEFSDDTKIVARLSGDEFAVLLPKTGFSDKNSVISIVENINKSMHKVFTVDEHEFTIVTSMGIAFYPEHGATSNLLLQYAELAMHHAKKNQLGYSFYDLILNNRSVDLLGLENDLRTAFDRDELSLAFQPKIDLKTNKIVSVEVLLRWFHEDKGFISPEIFIDVAEQTGLINDVTKWVFKTALKQKKEWDDLNYSFSMSINLSPKNLWDKNLLNFIRKELRYYNIMPQSICLELTETAVMSDPTFAIVIMNQLSDLGLQISIDDFGTGYSSLSYLKKLPVNEIKIDRSFVMEMDSDENDAIIVSSTIALAHNMGMQVVAEGVETEESLLNLKKQSCDMAQGFFMAKPMNNTDLMHWLEASPYGIKPNIKSKPEA